MKFYKQPEVSWNQWLFAALYNDQVYTRMGEYIAKKANGSVLIDIPCGNTPESKYSICSLAHAIGVQTYIEVDNDAEVLGSRLQHTPRTYNGMQVQTYCADIVDFLQGWHTNATQTTILYISGLQPDIECIHSPLQQENTIIPYLRTLYNAIDTCTKLGDIVILNDENSLVQGLDEGNILLYDPHLALIARGFSLQMHCMYGKVSVYEKIK